MKGPAALFGDRISARVVAGREADSQRRVRLNRTHEATGCREIEKYFAYVGRNPYF
jgi:hypothetical protein